MKKWIIIPVIIMVAGLAGGLIFKSKYREMAKFFAEYNLKNIDLQTIPDGTYNGKCGVFLVNIDLEVNILESKITDIKIIGQRCGRGYEGRQVIDRVLKSQSLQVDAKTGATGSSKCILIAIERALASGKAQ